MISLLPARFHHYIYLFALLMLTAALPLSKYLMSLSQLILIGNWILEGNLKEKFTSFFRNKPAMVLCSLLVLHFLGLIYTSDFNYAINDIRIKLPILALPLIVSTSSPINKKVFTFLMRVFIASTLVATIASTLILAGIIHREIIDTRDISIFISHIRFGLLICIAVFISIWFIRNNAGNRKSRLFWFLLLSWFLIFLVLMESLTALTILAATIFLISCWAVITSGRKLVRIAGVIAVALLVSGLIYVFQLASRDERPREPFNAAALEAATPRGNLYQHDLHSRQTENGYYVWTYFCWEELKDSWNKRSAMDFEGLDMKGNDLKYTLVRFLASKGLRKDQDGINALSEKEIHAVEHGVANVNYQDVSSLRGRIHETIWEIRRYRNTGDPNGHSLIQRMLYWQTAGEIIAQHPVIGVGTGDVQQAFDDQYVKDNSPLFKELRFHSHNQYLTMLVAFGFIGFAWFMFTLIYPMIRLKKTRDFLYMTFFIVAMFSFLNEDTLETQAGVTFYVFFNTIFLFAQKDNEKEMLVIPGKSLLFPGFRN